MCATCGKSHKGECLTGSGSCFNYGKGGHFASECQSKGEKEDTSTSKGKESKPKTNARVFFTMTREKAEAASDIVTGMILVHSIPACVLFDCGASHFFISKKFTKYAKIHA